MISIRTLKSGDKILLTKDAIMPICLRGNIVTVDYIEPWKNRVYLIEDRLFTVPSEIKKKVIDI